MTTLVTDAPPLPRIAAWQSAGMLDWPGRLSATVFIRGCPFRCPYCHNPELVGPGLDVELDALLDHLARRRAWLDGVVFTGGEPTADPGLMPLLEALRDLGLPVKLDTNGSNPNALLEAIEDGLVSMVALDVKTLPERYAQLTGVADAWDRVSACIGLLLDSGIEHEFRTTAYPGALTIEEFKEIARILAGGRRYAIQQFRPNRTLDPSASAVLPFKAEALASAARICDAYLPTIVRGAA